MKPEQGAASDMYEVISDDELDDILEDGDKEETKQEEDIKTQEGTFQWLKHSSRGYGPMVKGPMNMCIRVYFSKYASGQLKQNGKSNSDVN